jgi:hypothetical protein
MEKALRHGWRYGGHTILGSQMYVRLYRRGRGEIRFFIYVSQATGRVFGKNDPERRPCAMFVGKI